MVFLYLHKQFLMNPTEFGEIELAVLFLARALVNYGKGLGKQPFYMELIC